MPRTMPSGLLRPRVIKALLLVAALCLDGASSQDTLSDVHTFELVTVEAANRGKGARRGVVVAPYPMLSLSASPCCPCTEHAFYSVPSPPQLTELDPSPQPLWPR